VAIVVFKGFYTALLAGDLAGSPDVRFRAVLPTFSGEAEPLAINLADITTMATYDGANYADYDATSVAVAFDDADEAVYLDADNGAGNEFGAAVDEASDVTYGLVAFLFVDGTDANDIILLFTSDGEVAGQNGNGGQMGLTLPPKGIMAIAAAS